MGLFFKRVTRILRRNAHGYSRRRPFHALEHLHCLPQQLGRGTLHPDGYHVGMNITSVYSVGNVRISVLACSTASCWNILVERGQEYDVTFRGVDG